MQNGNAGKTVEQIAEELNPYRENMDRRIGWERGFMGAQQSQPMWREIEDGKVYTNEIVKDNLGFLKSVWNVWGSELKLTGYTHYLSSEDLLKLPVEKK